VAARRGQRAVGGTAPRLTISWRRSASPDLGAVAALEERLHAEPHLRLRYFCSPYHQGSALFPFIDQLGRVAGFARARIDGKNWGRPPEAKAQYHGDMVNFDEMMAWSKPVQRPHPPIIVGGAFPQAARRAIRYGDGWCPIGGRPGSMPSRAQADLSQISAGPYCYSY
jgi:hypothetical protein